MAQTPRRVAVIGMDCALPHLIEKHIAEGHLPTFKKLIEGGVIADNCLVPFPTITPPNWATIATGALVGTHQVTDFHVHNPGTPLDNANTGEAFSSERVKAEFLWDAADKAGKKCIVLNYPGSWPSNMKNGIMVGGSGLTVGEKRDGLQGLNAYHSLCTEQLVTTGVYPMSIRSKFESAEDWENAPELGEDPLEMEVTLKFPGARPHPPRTTWWVLARQSNGDGYDRITLSPTKDLNDAFFTIGVGEWSPKVATQIDMGDGTAKEVVFRAKVIELSDDAEDFRLLIGPLCETTGWSNPPEIAKEIVSEEGLFMPSGGVVGYSIGYYDLDTYVEINQIHDKWLGDAATTLLTKHDWDVFFMHSHPPDWAYHVMMTDMDPNTCKDKARHEKAWEAHLKIYQSQDQMLARILEAVGKDTLVFLVSDHGATADGPTFNPNEALAKAGLCSYQVGETTLHDAGFMEKMEKNRAIKVDTKTSKAVAQRSIHVYVNLKGRNVDGIVEPEDYEKVQYQIIDALLSYVDPATGKRPVALALPKKDARILGLYGDGIGDVIYAVYPWFGSQHGQALPTAEWGVGSLKGLLVINGPGIKKGHRLQRTCGLTDIVPTICYALDLPVPETVDGAILYQAFKDPNFKLKEIQKLKEGLARMETALARQEREPWDKHDCA